jgi:hypothetical protein
MSITLTHSGVTVTLPADLYWEDENSWYPVEQSVQRTITGALIVSSATRAGRSISLRSPDESSAWVTRDVVVQMQTWAGVAGLQMQITLRGVTRTVIFRHQDGAIEAVPIAQYSDVQPEDFYSVTLRFMEI